MEPGQTYLSLESALSWNNAASRTVSAEGKARSWVTLAENPLGRGVLAGGGNKGHNPGYETPGAAEAQSRAADRLDLVFLKR